MTHDTQNDFPIKKEELERFLYIYTNVSVITNDDIKYDRFDHNKHSTQALYTYTVDFIKVENISELMASIHKQMYTNDKKLQNCLCDNIR